MKATKTVRVTSDLMNILKNGPASRVVQSGGCVIDV